MTDAEKLQKIEDLMTQYRDGMFHMEETLRFIAEALATPSAEG
jgi:hypothetical protein